MLYNEIFCKLEAWGNVDIDALTWKKRKCWPLRYFNQALFADSGYIKKKRGGLSKYGHL